MPPLPSTTTPPSTPPPPSSSSSQIYDSPILHDLQHHLTGGKTPPSLSSPSHEHRTAVALPVAAIKSLLGVIKRSRANTMMGLQEELRQASKEMLEYARRSRHWGVLGGRSHIALASGCELFMKYITRCFLELPDFAECIAQILERGEQFAEISLAARDRIAAHAHPFIQDGDTVLTHGWSRVVTALLLKSALTKHFSILILEGRPDAAGAKAAKVFAQAGIPCTIVLDAAMAHVMEREVNLVIVGAEGVVENGGIVNKIGTYALGMAAKECGVPFYVAAESYKFARLFPLNQGDLPDMMGGWDGRLNFVDTASWEATGGMVGVKGQGGGGALVEGSGEGEGEKDDVRDIPGLVHLPEEVKVRNPPCDYTPAKYITLLFTDLGVLTTSAVSDELIRLYQ